MSVRVRRTSRGKANTIHQCLSPFCAINVVKLLKHDLNLLAIGRVHRDEVKALRKATNQLPPNRCSD